MALYELAKEGKVKTVIGSGLLINSVPGLYQKSTVHEKMPDRLFSVYSFKSTASNVLRYGSLMRSVSAAQFRGKRICLSAALKSINVDSAGLWVCVIGEQEQKIDDLPEYLLMGTREWVTQEIVMDVPLSAKWINYGVRLIGNGSLFCTEPVLSEAEHLSKELTGGKEWQLISSDPGVYTINVDSASDVYELKALSGTSKDSHAALRRNVNKSPYLGKRVRLTGSVTAKDVEKCGLWLRTNESLSITIDSMETRFIVGTITSQTYSLVIDVPPEALIITYGLYLYGKGACRLESPKLEVVDSDVSTSGTVYRGEP